MGIKSLISIQMRPWCFPLIWNHISCVHLRPEPPSVVGTIKLIKSDGIVKIYDQPINASDLMIEFPKHLVCHSDSFYIGQKIQALSENDKLQLGQKYFLLPKHFFQSVLSFVTIASFAAASSSSSRSSPIIKSNNNDFIKKVATCQPFDIRKTPSGSLQIRVSDEFISKLMEHDSDNQENRSVASKSAAAGGGGGSSKVCTTPQLEKDYSQLVGSVRQWKPKLDTITESSERRSRRRRLIGSFAGIHRNYKKKSQIQPKGSSSSSPNTKQMIVKKKQKSSEKYQNLHHHHHVTTSATVGSTSSPACQQQPCSKIKVIKTSTTTTGSTSSPARQQQPCSKIKVVKTKGRKICKF